MALATRRWEVTAHRTPRVRAALGAVPHNDVVVARLAMRSARATDHDPLPLALGGHARRDRARPPALRPIAPALVPDGAVANESFVEPHSLDDIQRVFEAVLRRDITPRAGIVH